MGAGDFVKNVSAFTLWAWAFVVYLLGVIMFGAWVRITHSGAGCGDHWPTCHGEIIPFEPTVETMIEFTHRVTSGMCGIFGIILVVWAYKRFKPGRVFWAMVVTLLLIIFEGLIGAGIVLAELVKDDDSVARAVVITIHLVNTLILMGAASLTAWWSQGGGVPRWTGGGTPARLMFVGVGLLVLTSGSGAITALGDTLFPVDALLGEGLMARVRDDMGAANHFLIRLRIFHPIIAVVGAAWFVGVGAWIRYHCDGLVRVLATSLMVVVAVQVLIGLVNVYLGAPGWIQLVHLAMAQAIWVLWVLIWCEWAGSPQTGLKPEVGL